MAAIQLIGAPVSLYTAKARAYLQYKAIPFVDVLATREVYRDVIVPQTGVRFIPVLISSEGVAIQDSSAIIQFMEHSHPEGRVYPEAPVQRLVALLFELYADEWLLLPAMHYRWNVAENRSFAIDEFGRLSVPSASPEEQRAIGEKLSGPFAGALPALGITATTAPAIEQSYQALLAELDIHWSQHRYLLGTRPSIGDFALFGPLYGHLYRDPASGRLMKKLAPRVAAWVERMLAPQPRSGSFLQDDGVPETLLPLLQRMFREFAPVLASTLEHLHAAAPELIGRPLPRAIGRHTFELAGVSAERAIYPFNLWRWQAARDQYLALAGPARNRADELLKQTGGLALMQTAPSYRLERRTNQLFVSPV